MNVVMTGDGRFVEVQGTAEGVAFTRGELDAMLGLAERGIAEIVAAQREMVAEAPGTALDGIGPPVRLPLPLVLPTGNADKAREIVEIFVEATGEPLVACAVDVGGRRRVGFCSSRPARRSPTRSERCRRCATAPDVEETGATLEANARIKADGMLAATRGARDRRRHRTRGRRARRRAGRVLARGTPASTRPTPTTSQAARASWRECTGRTRAPRGSRPLSDVRWPDGRERRRARRGRGRHRGVAARRERRSATTRCSYPTEGDGRTFAEMAPAEKHALSHRGRAFRASSMRSASPDLDEERRCLSTRRPKRWSR